MSSTARYFILFFLFAVPVRADPWPFRTRIGVTAIESFRPPTKWKNDCCQYVAAALIKATGVEMTPQLYDAIGNDINPAQEGVSFEILARYLDRYFETEVTQSSPRAIAEHLGDGFPVVVAIETDETDEDGYHKTHAVILTAYALTSDRKFAHWQIEDNGYSRGVMPHDEFIRRWSQPSYAHRTNSTLFIRPKPLSPLTEDAILTFDREKGWQEARGIVPPAPAPSPDLLSPLSQQKGALEEDDQLAEYNRIRKELAEIRAELAEVPRQLVRSLDELPSHPRVPLKAREKELLVELEAAYADLPRRLQTHQRDVEVHGDKSQPNYLQTLLNNARYRLTDDDFQRHLEELKTWDHGGDEERFIAPYPDLQTEIDELKSRLKTWPTYDLNQHAMQKRLTFLNGLEQQPPTAEEKSAELRRHFHEQFHGALAWSSKHAFHLAQHVQKYPTEHLTSFALGLLLATLYRWWRSFRRAKD